MRCTGLWTLEVVDDADDDVFFLDGVDLESSAGGDGKPCKPMVARSWCSSNR